MQVILPVICAHFAQYVVDCQKDPRTTNYSIVLIHLIKIKID